MTVLYGFVVRTTSFVTGRGTSLGGLGGFFASKTPKEEKPRNGRTVQRRCLSHSGLACDWLAAESLPRFHHTERLREEERREKISSMNDHGSPRIRSNNATNNCTDARLPKRPPGSHRIHLLQP